MLVKELIERLAKFPQDREVMILDGSNGGGHPREINLGPRAQYITRTDAECVSECEDIVGADVITIGYGCY